MSEPDPYTQVLQPGPGPAGYELLESVAEGPFSEVWRAKGASGQAAIKFARGPLGARMLVEEERVSRTLQDALLGGTRAAVPILESELSPGAGLRPFLVMPWVEGGTLRARLEAASDPDARAENAALFLRLVSAVEVVHLRGIVHGDLKPENVLLAWEQAQGREVPLLTDFGLATQRQTARLEQSLRASLQSDDALSGGTLAYMAPEIVKGGAASPPGDVYALGVILHEVLLGRRPSKLTTPAELARILPEEVVEVLVRALAVEPGERHATAGLLAHELRLVEAAITAKGTLRLAHRALRFALAGCAAFFLAVRYLSVVILLALYTCLALGTLVGIATAGTVGLVGLIPLFLLGLLHAVIRWEGPETSAEAVSRASGQVIGKRRT